MIWIAVRAALAGVSWLKIGMIIAAIVAVITAGSVIYHNIWERGYDWAIADIAKQDQKAVARAGQARRVVLDCQSRGMRWDQSTGICERR